MLLVPEVIVTLLLGFVLTATQSIKYERTNKPKMDVSVPLYSIKDIIYMRKTLNRREASTNAITSKIIGGEVAPVNQFPYHVGIVSNYGVWCGGALISDQHVLTAAHCVDELVHIVLYLGANNIFDENQLDMRFLIDSKKMIIHPDWFFPYMLNDIAIIPLPSKVKFSDRIQPIALPTLSDDNLDFEAGSVVATGWGYTTDNSTHITDVLRYAEFQLEPFNICRHFYPFLFYDSNICTSSRLKTRLCLRDDGGPLVYTRKDGSRFIAGIVSFISPVECSSVWPTLNTRVSKYIDWITEVTSMPIKN